MENKITEKILIIRLSGVGDVIHSLPLLSALRRKYIDNHITWLVSKKAEAVVAGNPGLDEVIVFEKSKGLRAWLSLIRKLKEAKFDLVIDPQSQFRSGVVAFLAGIPRRVGFVRGVSKEPNSIFMNEKVDPGKGEIHNVDRDLSFAKHLGIPPGEKKFIIHVDDGDVKYIEDFLKGAGAGGAAPLVGLSIAGSLPNKRWKNSSWAALIDAISSREKMKTIILWGPGEEGDVEEITKFAKKKTLTAPATDLKQLAALMGKCNMVIGNDSGPLHMAVAMGTSVIGLYGPSGFKKCGPYGEGNTAIRKDLSGLACFSRGRNVTRCRKFRRCGEKDCMDLITVEDVMKAVEGLLMVRGK